MGLGCSQLIHMHLKIQPLVKDLFTIEKLLSTVIAKNTTCDDRGSIALAPWVAKTQSFFFYCCNVQGVKESTAHQA